MVYLSMLYQPNFFKNLLIINITATTINISILECELNVTWQNPFGINAAYVFQQFTP